MSKTIRPFLSAMQGAPRLRGKHLSGIAALYCCLFLAFASSADSQGAANEWTWMSGSSTMTYSTQFSEYGQPGVYGTLGTPAPGNVPGSRSGASTWTDKSGNLWLFGGDGFISIGSAGTLNDLWEFNPSTNEWAWMGGSNEVSLFAGGNYEHPGVWGTLGKPAAGNIPGSREEAVGWTDNNGNLWLFGGYGIDSTENVGSLNDMWEFNPSTNQWTWMGGSSTLKYISDPEDAYGQPGVYGTLGTPAPGNIPGGRYGAVTWTDGSGKFWLFGGLGYDANGTWGDLNDLWEFNPSTNEWTWMGGSNDVPCYDCGQAGVYGTLGTPAAGNIPGGRLLAGSWTDKSGNLWLFGGLVNPSGTLNDLWKFSPSANEWAWMGGSTAADANYPGSPGPVGTPGPDYIPGDRDLASGWTDDAGNLWLFGGTRYTSLQISGGLWVEFNDLWEFNPATDEWALMGGGNSVGGCLTWNHTENCGLPAAYGTLGTPAPGNFPGSRVGALSWTDSSGNFWLSGGQGFDANANYGILNDLWKYQPPSALSPAATPTFSVTAGAYATPQMVTISDATPGATIYYAINGTPTTSSTVYSSSITVASTETLEAIATATGYGTSAVATAAYSIALPPWAQTITFAALPDETTATPPFQLDASASSGLPVSYSMGGSGAMSWTSGASMPTALSTAMAAAPGDGMLYFAGGTTPGYSKQVNTMQRYNPATNTWSNMAPMPTARYEGVAAAINGIIYVAGGWGATLPNSTLEAYNPATNTWASLASMPHLSGCSEGGAISGKLYVFTPCNGYSVSPNPSLLDVYDPVANSWTILPSGPNSHVAGAGGVINGKLYVVGGGGNSGPDTAILDVYDPASGWSTLAPMPVALNNMGGGVINGKLYVAGGANGTNLYSTVYVYDPATNTWSTGHSMSTALGSMAAVTSNGALYLAGGTNSSGAVVGGLEILSAANTCTVSGNTVTVTGVGTCTVTASQPGNANYSAAVPVSQTFNIVLAVPTVTVSPSSSSIPVTQSLTVTVAVSGGTSTPTATGSVKLTSGSYTSAAATLSSGGASINIPAGSLAAGTDTLTVTYTPDPASSSIYNSASNTAQVTVTKVMPTVTVTPSSSSVSTAQALTVTVAVSGGTGTPTVTGSVVLTSGSYTSTSTALTSGSASIIIPAGSLSTGADTLTATYTPDATSSPIYNGASNTAAVTITTPTFTIAGTAVTVTRGATTGNTSTITVTPVGGFTGSVSLTTAITASPNGAQYMPTMGCGSTSPVVISGAGAGTATLTVTTTAPTSGALVYPRLPGTPWYAAGSAALACLLLFGIPGRRRSWRTMLGMLAILAALAGGTLACGGTGGGGGGSGNPGTTAGAYTITITGTSGSTTATGTVTVSVQ